MNTERVIIAGAGPVGLVAAAKLVAEGIPVLVLEAGKDLSAESRASTFHPPTLDMLDELGAAKPLIEQGLVAPQVQYRSRDEGIIAQFDFGEISDLTAHPYRLQSEQFKLTRILYAMLRDNPLFSLEFEATVDGVAQDNDGVRVDVDRNGKRERHEGGWLIGADGARSAVRHALDIDFEGFTWPERFLVLSTSFDFDATIPDLVSVNYVADPQLWHFFLRVPGMWRIMFPIPQEISDETAVTHDYGQSLLAVAAPGQGPFEILHSTLYRVHQRVAKEFRKGRSFLAGDAAHINNPLGGMGMNGGIHDAVNLTSRLAPVCKGAAPETELDRYDLQRRLVTLEYVQKYTIQNKKNLEARDAEGQRAFREGLRKDASTLEGRRAHLERIAMIASLRRAAELG